MTFIPFSNFVCRLTTPSCVLVIECDNDSYCIILSSENDYKVVCQEKDDFFTDIIGLLEFMEKLENIKSVFIQDLDKDRSETELYKR